MKKFIAWMFLLAMPHVSAVMATSVMPGVLAVEISHVSSVFSWLGCGAVTLANGFPVTARVKNFSVGTVTNIRATLPKTSTPWSDITITYSNCDSVQSGEVCVITFTYPGVDVDEGTVIINGDSTNVLSFYMLVS